MQFIATGPIMDLCLAAERHSGDRAWNQWWEQEGIYTEEILEADQTEEAERDLWDRAGEEAGI